MRARGCRQRGSKQRAYRRAARSAACLASGHMIVWPRHSARVTRTPAATRASHGHMIVWPTSSRLVIVWPTSSRPRRAGDARVAMRAPGGHMVVWPRQAASRTATTRAPGGHMVVWPRQAASRTRRRVVSPPRAARATQDAQGRQVERPGASAPRSAAVAGAPWSTAAGQRAFAQLSGPAGSAAGGPASRREPARPQQREARVFRCPVFRCPWPFRTHIGTSAV